jgi:hypothetical protein
MLCVNRTLAANGELYLFSFGGNGPHNQRLRLWRYHFHVRSGIADDYGYAIGNGQYGDW